MPAQKNGTKPAQKPTKSARKRSHPGRGGHKPTEEQRQTAEFMAAIGIPQHDIAACFGMNHETLRKHFRTELDLGGARMLTKVAGSLYRQAMAGSVSACIFILKTRAGWSEHVDPKQPAIGKKEQLVVDARQPPTGSRWEGLLQ